jgi:hypothetical protein
MADRHPNLFFIIVVSIMLVIIIGLIIFVLVSRNKGVLKAKEIEIGPGLMYFRRDQQMSAESIANLRIAAQRSADEIKEASKSKAGIVKLLYGDDTIYGNSTYNGGFGNVPIPNRCMIPSATINTPCEP